MRDPERIERVLAAVGELWKRCPDVRLGQLIVNLSVRSGCGTDPFYLEDDRLLRAVEEEVADGIVA